MDPDLVGAAPALKTMTARALARGLLGSLSRHRWSIALVIGFVLVRAAYAYFVGLEFESNTLKDYQQYIDPELLRTDLLRSLFYLRDQPPLFNLFLGVVLKLFPVGFTRGFQWAYLFLGLSGALASSALGRRLGAGRPASAAIGLVISSLPGTLLYENWLFYGYPIAVVWIVAALALHEVLVRPTTLNALWAMGLVGGVALMRGTVHPLVLVGAVGVLALVRRRAWRKILAGSALPLVLVAALYVKHAVVFKAFFIGEFFRGTNISMMQMQQLDDARLRELEAEGLVSPTCPKWFHSYVDLDRLIRDGHFEEPRPTGIPTLDRPWKSTGCTNWMSTRAEILGKACLASGKAIRKVEPKLYWYSVGNNVARFFMPADRTWPFLREGGGNNADRLRSLNKIADTASIRVGSSGDSLAVIFAVALLFATPLAGLLRVSRAKKRGKKRRFGAPMLVATFAAGLFLYSSLVVLFASVGDHNRYRAEVMPLAWVVVLASVAAEARRRYRGLRLTRFRRRAARASEAR